MEVVEIVRHALQEVTPVATIAMMTALRSITVNDFNLRIFFGVI